PRPAVLRDPERADGGGVDHAAHARRACGLEDGARATDVDAVELLRVGRPEAVVGRDVEDDVDALHRALHGGWIQQVSVADLDVEPCKRAAVPAWSRQHAHRAALGEELADDVGADESRATGHERVAHCTGRRGAATLRGWPAVGTAWLRPANPFAGSVRAPGPARSMGARRTDRPSSAGFRPRNRSWGRLGGGRRGPLR